MLTPPQPDFATLNITGLCNSRCSYCVYSADKPRLFPEPENADLLRVVGQLADLGVRNLTLSGGEPTMREDLVDLVSAASARDLEVSVITNGTRTTHTLVSTLLDAGLTTLVVSCDSLDDLTYFNLRGIPVNGVARTMGTFQMMREAGKPTPRLAVSTVVSRSNVDSLLPLARRLLDELLPTDGWAIQGYEPSRGNSWRNDSLCFSPDDAPHLLHVLTELWELNSSTTLPLTATRAALERMYLFLTRGDLGEGYTCLTGYQGMFITAQLQCQPCWHLPPVGSLASLTPGEVWNSAEYDAARDRMVRLDCRRCSLVCHDPDFAAAVRP